MDNESNITTNTSKITTLEWNENTINWKITTIEWNIDSFWNLTLNSWVTVNQISNDSTLSSWSSSIPTSEAVKTYIDNNVSTPGSISMLIPSYNVKIENLTERGFRENNVALKTFTIYQKGTIKFSFDAIWRTNQSRTSNGVWVSETHTPNWGSTYGWRYNWYQFFTNIEAWGRYRSWRNREHFSYDVAVNPWDTYTFYIKASGRGNGWKFKNVRISYDVATYNPVM